MRKPFARLSRLSLYWQAYCVLAGPSCDGCEQIVRQQNFCTRIRQQKYTSRQPKSDRKMYQRLLWKKPGECHTEGAGLALCLARARASTRLNRFATLAPTEPQSFGEGERGRRPLCHIAKAETYPLRKDTDSRQRGSAGESPLVPMGAVPEFESLSLRDTWQPSL